MAVPYHTHTFEIPAATEADIEAGTRDDVAVTPSVLGTAATKDTSYFATASQGGNADTAVQSVNGKTGVSVTLDKNDVGLGSVDNTADLAKPISTATQNALDLKANILSLGSAAYTASTDYATASQGVKADTALQAPGGSAGQVLTKSSATDNDVSWQSIEAATAVSYAPQTLTTSQQGQALANVGADVLAGFRNKLINGDFGVVTRGQTFTIPAGSIQYTADRWTVFNQTNQPCTVNIFPSNTSTAFDGTHPPYMNINFAVAPTSGTVEISQPIESVFTLSGKTATFTVLATTSDDVTISGRLAQVFGNGGGQSPNVTVPLSFVEAGSLVGISKYNALVEVPSVDGKTIDGDNHYVRTAVIFTPRASGNIYLTKCSFVEGDATAEADPFSPRHRQQEEELCLRYCCQMIMGVQSPVAGNMFAHYKFPVRMRVTPTLQTISAGTSANATLSNASGNLNRQGGYFQIQATAASGFVDGWLGRFDAEL